MKSGLAAELELANRQIQYDEHVKYVLSNRYILAWILKSVADEFQELELTSIAQNYIQPNIEIASVPVLPGQTNAQEKLLGDTTEDKVPYEGYITYDIRFHAVLPAQPEKAIKLLLNVEAQKTFTPGYPIITRGIFYGARMISAQMNTEFSSPNYGDLKKVYSIWICMNAPNYIGNAISTCSIKKEDIAGHIPMKRADYDKLTVITISLNGKAEEDGIFRLLNTLLSSTLPTLEKERILEQEFSIPMHQEHLSKEVRHMCNLSEWVLEQGIDNGIELAKKVLKLSAEGLSVPEIADTLQLSLERVEKILE